MELIRKYNNYNDYLAHQAEKSTNKERLKGWLGKDWLPKVEMFLGHFERNKDFIKGKALGICARTGQEIEALKNLGVDAIGIDIVPHPPLVIQGDAHNIPFEDDTFDFVFSNSLDHSIKPELFLSEMHRVLKPRGFGMLHLQLTDQVDIYAENIITDTKEVPHLLPESEILESRKIKDICYNHEIIFRKL